DASSRRGTWRTVPRASKISSLALSRSAQALALTDAPRQDPPPWSTMRRASHRRFHQRTARDVLALTDRHRVRPVRAAGYHVAGIDGEENDAIGPNFFGPDCRQVAQRRLAGAIGAPSRIGVDCSVTGNVDHERGALVAGGGGERPEKRLGQPEHAKH